MTTNCKVIYVDILNGSLQAVCGDDINDEVEFVLRDWDNIHSGDDDPTPEGYVPERYYL